MLTIPQKKFLTQQTTIQILKERLPLRTKTHSFYTMFDDMQSRIGNLKPAENLKREFKRDSIRIKR